MTSTGRALVGAVREHRHRLRAADGVDLVDAEQRAGREDRRVRAAAELGLRRARDREAPDAGHLRRDDVHDHAARVGDQPARHVEPDPADRHPALGDGGAVDDLHDLVVAQLRPADRGGPGDRLLERRADRRVEPVERLLQRLGRHAQLLQHDAVEPLGRLADGVGPAVADRLDHRPDLLDGAADVEDGAREQVEGGSVVPPAQVEAGQHGRLLRGGDRARQPPSGTAAASRRDLSGRGASLPARARPAACAHGGRART